jgi:hypothetical protein
LADLTTFTRQAVKSALVTNIAAQLDQSTAVTSYDPGPRNLKNEHIFVQAISGSVDYPAVAAGIYPHDDRFTVNFFVYVLKVGRSASGETAGDRCEELMNAINTAVHQDINLDGYDGVIDCTLSSVEGPDVFPHQEGWAGIAEIDVDVHSRIFNR